MPSGCLPKMASAVTPSSTGFRWHMPKTPMAPTPLANPHPQLKELTHQHSRTAPQLPARPSGDNGERSSCISAPSGRLLVPTLHPARRSSRWQPPSASPPAFMTFINDLCSFWILMKSGNRRRQRTCVWLAQCLCMLCTVVLICLLECMSVPPPRTQSSHRPFH